MGIYSPSLHRPFPMGLAHSSVAPVQPTVRKGVAIIQETNRGFSATSLDYLQ